MPTSWRKPPPSLHPSNGQPSRWTPRGWRQREQAAMTKGLPPGQEGVAGQDQASRGKNSHAVSCKGFTGVILLMLNSPKNYLGRERHQMQCAWDKSDSMPPLPSRDAWHSKKCPETKIINTLCPAASSLSGRDIAQQTRFIYQSSVRLGHMLLLSITTFNQLIVSECLCVTNGEQGQDWADAGLCHAFQG